MSTTGQVLPWLPPPTQRKLTNVRPSIMSCWPFQNCGSQKHVSLPKRGWGGGENRRDETVCHLLYIFTEWSSHQATLPHSNQGQALNLDEIALITSPFPAHPQTHTQKYRFSYSFPDGWTWSNGWVHATAAESHKASPQKTCECSEVESKSICSCARPSVPRFILPSTLLSTPVCSYDWVTGFYIIHN